MKATVLHGPRDIRFEDQPDPKIVQPTDAIIRMSATCVCGSDLWPYRGLNPLNGPTPMGHEYCGIVEEVGRDVKSIKRGQFVIGSFATSDNTCPNCRYGYPSSCVHREFMTRAQAPVLRVPMALFGLWAASAGATIIGFTYTGSAFLCSTCSFAGSGSFSFADSPTSISLGDLTAFSFVLTYADSSVPETDTYTYGLADLISFSATLDSSQNLTALSLQTDVVAPDGAGTLDDQYFVVTSLTDAETFPGCLPRNCKVTFPSSTGSITAPSAVPEPATIFLLMLAASGLLGHFFSRRDATLISN